MNLMGMRTTGPGRRLKDRGKLACLISLVLLASAFWGCASSQSEHKKPLRDLLLNNTQESTGYTETSDHLEVPALLSPTEDSLPGETPLVANMWFETDLRQVLMDLSQETGVSIVWDSSVEGLITYEAVDVPLVKVLEDVLFTNGYVYKLRDGTYYVGSAGVDSPSFHLLSDTYTFQLSNIMAQDAVQLLPEPFKPYVRATKDLNMVCVTAPPSIGKRIIQDLTAIDTPGTQIEIEVLVVEFSKTKIRKLGIDWDFSSVDWKNQEGKLSASSQQMEDAVLALDYFRTALKLGSKAVDLTTSLKALSDVGIADIRATPRLITLNGRTAVLGITKEQYFFITSGDEDQYYGVYNRLETIESGIKLEITPYADSMGYITVNVKPEVDDVIGQGASGLPEISRRTASTTVRVKDGETITIGGLCVKNEKMVKRRVPILGEIPILGLLFGRTEKEVTESELVIFITPRVL